MRFLSLAAAVVTMAVLGQFTGLVGAAPPSSPDSEILGSVDKFISPLDAQPPPIPGDFNNDGLVNSLDIDLLYANLGNPAFDLDGDADADQADVNKLVIQLIGTRFGDANIDFSIDGGDLTLLADGWTHGGRPWSKGEFTGNNMVDAGDLALMAGNWMWSRPSPGPAAVPEPTALVMLAMGGLALLRRRK